MSKGTPSSRWVEFFLKYWSGIFGVGAMTIAGIVFLATLSPRLSAAEKKNVLQDEAIVELKKSNEIWQQMYQQQTRAPKAWPMQDRSGRWHCTDDTGQLWAYTPGKNCE